MARELGLRLTGGTGRSLLGVGLAIALAASLCACSGPLANLPNPFRKKEEILPGERIAVITDPNASDAAPSGPPKPITLPPPHANESWSEPGGAPSNNLGHLALNEQVQKIWSADAGTGSSWRGRLSAEPLVAGGKVYTLDAGGTVSAFSADSGARVWSASITPDNESRKEGFGGGIALDGGHLYAATGYGTAVGIDVSNGSILWKKTIGEPVRSSPTAAGGKLFFISADNVLHALKGDDGNELWTARGLPEIATLLSNVSPAVGNNVVVAPFPAGDVAAFDVASGKSSWSDSLARETETSAAGNLGDPARPVIDKGVVFAVSHGGKMIATSEANGERLWTRNIASTQMPWVAGDAVYVVDLGGKLWALSRTDGAVKWTADLPPGGRWSGPVLAGGRLWLVSGDGLLVGADPRSGQVIANLDLGTKVFVSPVVAGGRMYILADNATLIALN
jgi:outer membrane protein assembly factor BamB